MKSLLQLSGRFFGRFFGRFQYRLSRIFVTEEIQNSTDLQVLYWALLPGFILSFIKWYGEETITLSAARAGNYVCPPYFQTCAALYFFDSSPFSYGQEMLYAVLFATLIGSAVAAAVKRWELACFFLLPSLLWKVVYFGLLTSFLVVEFEYFHISILLMFLFAHRKEYFARRSWVLLYLMAATAKFTESWITGNYFTSLKLGIPMFPDAMTPLITNCIIAFECITPWFLLSQKRVLRFSALFSWLAFHAYSVILVGFNYPLYCIPILLALFFPDPNAADEWPSFSRKDAFGWLTIATLLLLQIVPEAISRENLYKLEGRQLGMHMFIANYQCVSTSHIKRETGTEEVLWTDNAGTVRCDPYFYFFKTKQLCNRPGVKSVSWKLLSSVNGRPFYAVADLSDICVESYYAFSKNAWLRSPTSGASIGGYPVKNPYRKRDLTHKILYSEPSIQPTRFEEILLPHVAKISMTLWACWLVSLCYFCTRRLRLRRAWTKTSAGVASQNNQ